MDNINKAIQTCVSPILVKVSEKFNLNIKEVTAIWEEIGGFSSLQNLQKSQKTSSKMSLESKLIIKKNKWGNLEHLTTGFVFNSNKQVIGKQCSDGDVLSLGSNDLDTLGRWKFVLAPKNEVDDVEEDEEKSKKVKECEKPKKVKDCDEEDEKPKKVKDCEEDEKPKKKSSKKVEECEECEEDEKPKKSSKKVVRR